MLLLIFSLPITSLKTTKMGMTLKVWILLCIWLSNFFLVIGYIFVFINTKSMPWNYFPVFRSDSLAHFFPMHPFSIPWKDHLFSGVEKRCIGNKWVKVILIAPATKTILKSSFSKSMKAKTPIISTIKDSRLNHFLMKLIYNEELEETDTKFITNELKVKESRIITSWLHQFWAFPWFHLFIVAA